jgi:hypothetical protein
MSTELSKRRRRANGELGEMEALDVHSSEPHEHYFYGIFEAQPEHFAEQWPTLKVETFVEMVFGSIKERGQASQNDIRADTGLNEDLIGKCLADLLLWKESVATSGEGFDRVYFVKE